MKLGSRSLDVLWTWEACSTRDRRSVLQLLMPDDDLDTLRVVVTGHPRTVDGDVAMYWCEIEVHVGADDGQCTPVCRVIVDYAGEVSYEFDGDLDREQRGEVHGQVHLEPTASANA